MNGKLPKAHYIFCMGTIIPNAGGVTRAMLHRAVEFLNNGASVELLFCGLNIKQYEAIAHYIENGFDIESAKVTTSRDYFAENYINRDVSIQCDIWDKPGDTMDIRIVDKKRSDLIYRNGIMYAKIEYNSDNKKVIHYNENNEYISEDIYLGEYKIKEITAKRIIDGKESYTERYYSTNGFCFLSIQYIMMPEKGRYVPRNIVLFNQKDKTARRMKSIDELQELFISEVVEKRHCQYGRVFFISENFLRSGYRCHAKENSEIFRIGVCHSPGIKSPRNWNSEYYPSVLESLNNVPTIDGIILLTQEALNDYSKRFGQRSQFYHIPNTINIPSKIHDYPEHVRKDVVFIGRFAAVKQCSHLILAFREVVKSIPNAVLRIFGRGELENEIFKLIQKEHLSNSVFLEPFTNEPDKVFQSALCSIVTSEYEGFCLSLHESLANGCPVISYKFKYGPSDIIRDGFNGFLVERNNIMELAKKLIFFLENPLLHKNMRINAYKSIEHLSDEGYIEKWRYTLEDMINRKPYKNFLKGIGIDKLSHNKINGRTTLICTIDGYYPEISLGRERVYLRIYSPDNNSFTTSITKWSFLDKVTIRVSFILPSTVNRVTICLEWENSFFEQNIAII